MVFIHILVGPPAFSFSPRSTNIPANSSVSFLCSATGYPLPSLIWFKDNSEILSEAVEIHTWQSGPFKSLSNLTLNGLSDGDTAGYYCLATNDLVSLLTQTSQTAFLTVHCEWHLLMYTIIDCLTSKTLSANNLLLCRSSKPIVKLQWYNWKCY